MMDASQLKRVSKHMALLLRHEPERAGLVLDPEGYVHLDDLVSALRHHAPGIDVDAVRAVVDLVEPHKQRYTIVGDYVRANYGHSTERRIEHTPMTPPDVLFHGTTVSSVPSILSRGLMPMARQYVHLTTDVALASSVGTRHGKPALIAVDARAAHLAGVVFHKANFTFWLASAVPAGYLAAA